MKFNTGYKAEIDAWIIQVVIPAKEYADLSEDQIHGDVILPVKRELKKYLKREKSKAMALYSKRH